MRKLVVIIILLAIIAWFFSVSNSAFDYVAGYLPKNKSAPLFTLSIEKFTQDYKDNFVAAELNYENKPLLITGIVSNIKPGFARSVYLMLGSDKFLNFSRVKANIAHSDYEKVAELEKGIEVELLCIGSFADRVPTLKKCTIEKIAPVKVEPAKQQTSQGLLDMPAQKRKPSPAITERISDYFNKSKK